MASLYRFRQKSNSQRSSRSSSQLEVKETYFSKLYSPITNFKRAVKIIQVIIALRTKKQNELSKVDTYTTLSDYANEIRHEAESALFDVTLYKANKELRSSSDTKALLMLPNAERTSSQIEKTLLSLRSIKSFAEYPKRMQRKLVQVGWYESHKAKRLIVRQGHPPQAFYFILSGKAVVKVLKADERFARTICYLKRGESFGELSIIHSTKRQATVISEESVELLCISKKDFINIFMSSGLGQKNLYDPDFELFIKEIKFLHGWPVHLLHNNPKYCLFNYFRLGSVLVKDSNYSEWLYVIKSGSCRVMKRLKKIERKEKTERKDSYLSGHQDSCLISRACTFTTRTRTRTNISVRPKTAPIKQISISRNHSVIINEIPNEKISIIDSAANKNSVDETSNDDCFVEIAILQKGDAFGLQNIFCIKQPSLSLISNGAEILMISKKYFLRNCTDQHFHFLERTTPNYPSNSSLQNQLEVLIRWNEYKERELTSVTSTRNLRRCKSAR